MTMAIIFPAKMTLVHAGANVSIEKISRTRSHLGLVSELSSVYSRLSLRAQVPGFYEHHPWLLSLENGGKIP